MSLTTEQIRRTKNEFQENLSLSKLSLQKIAHELNTSIITIENTLNLNVQHLEDPWVLKIYLEEKIALLGETPIPFTALVGDYHHHWFLDARRIKLRKIG